LSVITATLQRRSQRTQALEKVRSGCQSRRGMRQIVWPSPKSDFLVLRPIATRLQSFAKIEV